jgi:hypothetical protein
MIILILQNKPKNKNNGKFIRDFPKAGDIRDPFEDSTSKRTKGSIPYNFYE